MTAQLLSAELTNLIQESKRKHNDLRQAAEKSLEDLKGLKASNEAQVALELSQKVNFVNPFIIACGTKNAKYTSIAIVCLHRLIVSKALPRTKLSQVLEALQQASSAGLDVQLKILQALPALLSNYAADLKGDLLVTALNICFILQSSKNAIVNNTSAATLQQLVVTVFDKVAAEDKTDRDVPPVGEASTRNGSVPLKPAALDAYRLFDDLCLLTESQRAEYLRASALPTTFGLELIESVLTNHSSIFLTHAEQAEVLRTRVMPLVNRLLSENPNFATSVRLMRILYTLLKRHLSILQDEGGEALELLTKLLDHDPALWKRSLCMEVFRGIFAEPGLLRRIFVLYDGQEGGGRTVLKSLMATFVRVSTEKPSLIGLGHQSTIPTANPYASIGASADQAMLEASVTGIISSSSGSEGHNTGISTQWSLVRVPCIDQLDKTEPPSIPESYVYGLTLACITSLSEGLAKYILPLTVPEDGRGKRRGLKQDARRDSVSAQLSEEPSDASTVKGPLERSASFKKNPVPINPLLLEDHPLHSEVRICAAIIDECWPAILATCSTFLYASLDSEYYHGLIRAFQKFAHVAGLLQLNTPRDAFLTTLGKAAVPPNVFTACLNAGAPRPSQLSATAESPGGIFSNARGLLSVESLGSQGTPTNEKSKQSWADIGPTTLNTRNLLCLRALLNLGIALGPTLSSSWRVILETLQQADFVLFYSNKAPGRTPIATRTPDQQAEKEATLLLSNFATEIKAVETAASRLLESTVDFPNDAFVEVLQAVCSLLEKGVVEPPSPAASEPQLSPSGPSSGLRPPSTPHRRVMSISTGVPSAAPSQEDQFALAKLGDLASINMERLLSYSPEVSGWLLLVGELIDSLSSTFMSPTVRQRAANTLVRIVLEATNAITTQADDVRGTIQLRLLKALRAAILPLQADDRGASLTSVSTDTDIHKIILDGLKSILESCGESLVEGWDVAFEVIQSIFVERRFRENEDDTDPQQPVLLTRSTKLIRPSFAALQLICSDFLSALPGSCILNLVDTLYKFCSQDDDLNVALTTITFFWTVSDFLSSKGQSMALAADMVRGSDEETLAKLAADGGDSSSDAALWMLLLLRLTTVTSDERAELRNSAVQILFRIVSAYGDRLTAESWPVCIRFVIFRMLASVEDEMRDIDNASTKETNEWKETAIVIIEGTSSLFAMYVPVLAASHDFLALWRELVGHYTALLDLKFLGINAAVFGSLGNVLSRCSEKEQPGFNQSSVLLAWDLWSRSIPLPDTVRRGETPDNQKCLLAWAEALLGLYRLMQRDLTAAQVQRMLALLRAAMQQATAGAYESDTDHVTPLQGRILEVFRMVRTDIPRVPAAMIAEVAEFVSRPFARDDSGVSSSPDRRTYVAMSKESMPILRHLILTHASESEIYGSGAYAAALSALAKPITLKYKFPIRTKSVQPWRIATSTALAVLEATLPHLSRADIERSMFEEAWQTIITIAHGIMTAECDTAFQDAVLDDQGFDIASFYKLRELIIPALGGSAIPEDIRKSYAASLFVTSIIHAPAPAEALVGFGNSKGGGDVFGLAELYKPRNGRTVDSPATQRAKMSYVCLDELFALVAAHDADNPAPMILVQPPTPQVAQFFPGAEQDTTTRAAGQTSPETAHAMHVRLARTAAPYLILRCALSLRAYSADQPLRGRMPQPLSQRRELAHILTCLVKLCAEPDAIPDMTNVDSEGRKHLLRLYPLLVSVMHVAGRGGDDSVLGLVNEALRVVGEELGI